jgi:hypothetical protein
MTDVECFTLFVSAVDFYKYHVMVVLFLNFHHHCLLNGVEGLFKPDSGTQYSIDIALGRKRRITEGEDSDDENSETAPPLHDISINIYAFTIYTVSWIWVETSRRS